MDGVLSIARTDAEGNAFWSARDLMPLMGYTTWQKFNVPLNRAEQSAKNVGMNCSFNHLVKRTEREIGGSVRRDIHLDRMAAYLVAMNGDPNKPDHPRQIPPFAKRANLQPCNPHLA